MQLAPTPQKAGNCPISCPNLKRAADLTHKFRISAHVKKCGKQAIVLQCFLFGKQIRISTSVVVHKNEWNDKAQKVMGRNQQARDCNMMLSQYTARVEEVKVYLRLGGKPISESLFKAMVSNEATRSDFITYASWRLSERKKYITHGTYKHEKTLINHLKQWKGQIFFSEISNDLLIDFQQYCKKKLKNKHNTIATKTKKLVTYLHHAQKDGMRFTMPDNESKVREQNSGIEGFDKTMLKRMCTLYDSDYLANDLHQTLRLFLWGCFTGQRYGDIKTLTSANITNGYLHYQPAKTEHSSGVLVKMKIPAFALKLLSNHKYPLGVVYSNEHLNRQLKKLRVYLGKPPRLTFHMSRHTFGTIYIEQGGNVVNLQAFMGHSKIETTMKYVSTVQGRLNADMDLFNDL